MDRAVVDKFELDTACNGEEVARMVDSLLVECAQNRVHFAEIVVHWDCMPVDWADNDSF